MIDNWSGLEACAVDKKQCTGKQLQNLQTGKLARADEKVAWGCVSKKAKCGGRPMRREILSTSRADLCTNVKSSHIASYRCISLITSMFFSVIRAETIPRMGE